MYFKTGEPVMPREPDPAGIIRRALDDARDRGLDSLGQINHAVRQVLALRPDMGRRRAEALVQEAIWPRSARLPRGGPAAVPPPRRGSPSALRPGSGG